MKIIIEILPGMQAAVVSSIEEELIRSKIEIFQFNDSLVRIGIRDGSPYIIEVDNNWLLNKVSETISFERLNKDFDWVSTDITRKYIDMLLAKKGEWKFRNLKGISNTPIINEVGKVIFKKGYDEETGFYFSSSVDWDLAEIDFDDTDLSSAVEVLKSMSHSFPFASESDRSVYLSALLSLFIPSTNINIPIFGFSANAPGSGKSALVDMLGIIVSGEVPTCFSWGEKEDESEKRLSAKLMTKERLVFIDNVERPMRSELLCSYATQKSVSMRILGKSEFKSIQTTPIIIATGNNLKFEGDLIRRSLLLTLNANCERPELRKFDFDPLAYCYQNRKKIVAAALKILKVYIKQSITPKDLSAFGSFDKWSNLIRGALVHYKLNDPCETIRVIRSNDPELETLETMLISWNKLHGSKPLKVVEVINLPPVEVLAADKSELMSIVTSMSYGKDILRVFGNYLARNEGRIVNGLSFAKDKSERGSARWKVITHLPDKGLSGL